MPPEERNIGRAMRLLPYTEKVAESARQIQRFVDQLMKIATMARIEGVSIDTFVHEIEEIHRSRAMHDLESRLLDLDHAEVREILRASPNVESTTATVATGEAKKQRSTDRSKPATSR